MNYQEFTEPNTDLSLVHSDFIDQDLYESIHKNSIITCQDVFIKHTNNGVTGFVLLKRRNHPAKGVLWPVGGRILRGVEGKEALAKKALDECGLTIKNITFLSVARTIFSTDPFGHGKGTDTLNLIYTADGTGELTPNKDHELPHIVTKENYKEIQDALDPYVRTYLDLIDSRNLW
jgi:ADP-ribose pyrophosphatase YjhB (NUDIX family)